MNVALFFTYGVSLKNWLESGLLDREIEIYEKISQGSDIRFTFITYGSEDDLEIINDNNSIHVLPIGKYLNSSNRVFYFLKSLIVPFKIKNKLNNIDLIKTNQLMGSWVAIILKFIIKKPLIVRTGYDLLEFSIKENKSFIKKTFYYILTYKSLLFCDKYFVSSNIDVENIKKRFKFINDNKLELRPNWVNIKKVNKEFNDRNGHKLLTIGRLEKQKNYISLIQSLEKTNLELDIVGDGSLKDEIKDAAEKHNVKINFLGVIKNKEILELIENYKYFILYSKYEGHPKSLIEAMSKGCIALVLKNKNIEEIIDHQKNGIIIKDENESIVKWLEHFKNNKNEALNISLEAQNFVASKFSLDNYIVGEINDYKELLSD